MYYYAVVVIGGKKGSESMNADPGQARSRLSIKIAKEAAADMLAFSAVCFFA